MREYRKQEIEHCLNKILEGDKNGVEVLYDLMQSKLYFLAFKYLHNEREVENLLSDFWTNIYSIAKKYKYSLNAYNYLNTVVINMALMRLRKRKTILKREISLTPELLEKYEAIQFEVNNALVSVSDLRQSFKKGFKMLNDTEKMIIYMIYWEEKTIRDCAKIIKISKSQVSRIKRAACEKLKGILQEDGWDKD